MLLDTVVVLVGIMDVDAFFSIIPSFALCLFPLFAMTVTTVLAISQVHINPVISLVLSTGQKPVLPGNY